MNPTRNLLKCLCAVLILLLLTTATVFAQELTTHRVLTITLATTNPSDLAINRGRLIWKDEDGGGKFYLKYYSGGEIFVLDSLLTGVRAAINGDDILWSTPTKLVKRFNTRTWVTDTAATNAYTPAWGQPVSISNGLAAFVTDRIGGGSVVQRRNLAAATDSLFDEEMWNREPSINLGQLAWVSSAAEDTATASSIRFFDGRTTKIVSDTNTVPNRNPILKDAGIVWLQYGSRRRVKAYLGDSLLTLAEANNQSVVIGYDISDGIAAATVTDTVNTVSTIRIYQTSSGQFTNVIDSNLVQRPRIDNGLVVWVSGTGGSRSMKLYSVQGTTTEDLGIADLPVIDDGEVAWTLGDAVMMRVPVTYEKLTTDLLNGWAQRRFKTIENGKILWGNFADQSLPQSANPRMYYSGGGSTIQLTDSVDYKDFEMVNGGYAIWRYDFTKLFVYDGVNPPVMAFDSLQCENMYVADGSIGFQGFKSNAGNSIFQAWIYRIATDSLIQLTNSTSADTSNGITLVDGNAAVWTRTIGQIAQEPELMYYGGQATSRLSDSLIGNKFSFVDGIIVWSELRSGVYQIMMRNTASGGTVQLTSGSQDAFDPVTDGSVIAWFENDTPVPILVYYEIASGTKTKVARLAPSIVHWYWMSNGRIAWSGGNEVRVFDGSVISQLTGSGDFTPNTETYVDNETVVWKQQSPTPGIPILGDIFRGKLVPQASFDAVNIAGSVPLAVTFQNRSWQGARSYTWDFGDGGSSTQANPAHVYSTPGHYSVTLTVTGITGTSVEKKWKLVHAGSITGSEAVTAGVPLQFSLEQNYPNPFNPETAISYQLSAVSSVKLIVYDLLGREVARLVDETLPAGVHQVTWNAAGFPSGVYLLHMTAGSFSATRKVVLVR